jgi:hypothetical protein
VQGSGTTFRRSARHGVDASGASATDEDSMIKAMRRKAERNLDSPGILSSSKSFLSFSTPVISSKLANVGISLGSSRQEVSFSSNVLRHMEVDRLTVTPKVAGFPDASLDEEEELHATVDGQLLSHLVGEVSEVDFDETGLASVYELKASGRKSKSQRARKRSRVSKSPIVSQ